MPNDWTLKISYKYFTNRIGVRLSAAGTKSCTEEKIQQLIKNEKIKTNKQINKKKVKHHQNLVGFSTHIFADVPLAAKNQSWTLAELDNIHSGKKWGIREAPC